MPWSLLLKSIAADLPLEEMVDEIKDFDERFRLILRKHTSVFTLWSVLNILAGLIGLFFLQNQWWYFSWMNLAWGAINYFLVLHLYNHTYYLRFLQGDILDRFEVQWHVENMLWLNIGLDTAYIFAGLFLWSLSFHPQLSDPDLWIGFGLSVILQGIFLFVMDNLIRYFHRKNLRQCQPFLEQKLNTYQKGA